jgi:hypothetical protein
MSYLIFIASKNYRPGRFAICQLESEVRRGFLGCLEQPAKFNLIAT